MVWIHRHHSLVEIVQLHGGMSWYGPIEMRIWKWLDSHLITTHGDGNNSAVIESPVQGDGNGSAVIENPIQGDGNGSANNELSKLAREHSYSLTINNVINDIMNNDVDYISSANSDSDD